MDDYSLLPKANHQLELTAQEEGYVKKIDAVRIGLAAMKIGAGRQKKDDIIDPAVGVWIYKKVGEKVSKGKPFAKILANDAAKLHWAADEVKSAFEFSYEQVEKRKVIWAKITKDGVREL